MAHNHIKQALLNTITANEEEDIINIQTYVSPESKDVIGSVRNQTNYIQF